MDPRKPLERDFDVSVEDLLEMPEINQVLATDTSISTSSTHTINTSFGSVVLETNLVQGSDNDAKASTPQDSVSDAIEAEEEEKPKAEQQQKQEEEEHLAYEMSNTMHSSSIQAHADESSLQDAKPQHVSQKTSFSGTKCKLSTGQYIQPANTAEVGKLRHKLKVQTAELAHRKHQKDEDHKKVMRIKKLKAELAHLRGVEAELLKYEQKSVESLRSELEMHKKTVSDLSVKLEDAGKEEAKMVKRFKDNFRK